MLGHRRRNCRQVLRLWGDWVLDWSRGELVLGVRFEFLLWTRGMMLARGLFLCSRSPPLTSIRS